MDNPTPTSDVPTAVRTQGEAREEEVDRAIVWVVQRRRIIIAAAVMAIGGAAAGWKGLESMEATMEERVLARQASVSQSEHVRANGRAVEALGARMAKVEDAIAVHAEMTRTGIELLLASPGVAQAIEGDTALSARAASAVARDTK